MLAHVALRRLGSLINLDFEPLDDSKCLFLTFYPPRTTCEVISAFVTSASGNLGMTGEVKGFIL